jgi:hypothetical protein
MAAEAEEMILVSKAELDRLRKLESELPSLVEEVRKETTQDRFKQLAAMDTPEKIRERAKKYYHLHKEEIKARRREKKEASRVSLQ